jgi:hypothetical protein
MGTRGLKLLAETAGNVCLLVVACLVGLAITVAATLASTAGAPEPQEETMDNELAHRKMVRISFFSVIGAIGTAAIGGLLAA